MDFIKRLLQGGRPDSPPVAVPPGWRSPKYGHFLFWLSTAGLNAKFRLAGPGRLRDWF